MPAYGPHLVAAYSRLVAHLATKDDVLLLTTSNRYEKHASWDVPKTTQLARRIEVQLKGKRRRVTLLDVAGLRIHTCGTSAAPAVTTAASATPSCPTRGRTRRATTGAGRRSTTRTTRMVLFGHNWNDRQVLATQKKNFGWFRWKTPDALSFYWQYTARAEEESLASYRDARAQFRELVQLTVRRPP